VRCKNGQTRIRIIGEKEDENKDWGKEEKLNEEDIVRIRS
jgi:hypothetical protein